MNQNLHQQLAAPFERAPERPFMITRTATLTGGDFLTTSQRLAQRLSALGLEPGARVMVQVEKSPQAVMLYLACLQTGVVLVPLNTTYTASEVEYFLRDAQPDLLVCAPHDMRAAAALAGECGVAHVESLGANGDGTLMEQAGCLTPLTHAVPRLADDLAAILYTSGTTGRPKGAMLSHGNLASNCQALVEAWAFTADDRLIHALPIFHTHGLFVACNVCMAVGAPMFFLEKLDVDELIKLMPQATVLMGVPTFYTRLLQSPRLDHTATAHMRLFISGSAPLQVETHRAFEARTGHVILERYGMTETNMNASNPYHGERKAGTVGQPLPGVEIRIVHRETGAPLPPGEPGMIEVRGPNVFRGYWRLPDKTAAEFRDDGFFVTGDLGTFDGDGYLCIIGRDKDLVISGGLNVYPSEVERLLDEIPGIAESAVIGLPHADLGEAVTAVVVPSRPEQPVTEDEVRNNLAERMAPYKRPKRVIAVESLPRNAMGKVQKSELRSRYAHLYNKEL